MCDAMSSESGKRAATLAPKLASSATQRRLVAAELFAGAREVLLTHADELYRLRITRNNKLILTK